MIVVHVDGSWEDDDGQAHAEPLSTVRPVQPLVSRNAGWAKSSLAELLGPQIEQRRQQSAGGRGDGGSGDG